MFLFQTHIFYLFSDTPGPFKDKLLVPQKTKEKAKTLQGTEKSEVPGHFSAKGQEIRSYEGGWGRVMPPGVRWKESKERERKARLSENSATRVGTS